MKSRKILKAGILTALLGIPALSFVLLKIFGSNSFDLPHYFPQIGDDGEVMIVAGDTLFTKVPDFTLIGTKGESVDITEGKVRVVNFFFTRCGTICPIINTNLIKVAEVFKKDDRVEFVGITVDPVFDTPDVLKQYSEAIGGKDLNYQFLTGDKKRIYDLAIEGFKLPVADASEYDKSIKDIDEMFIHSDKVLLIDNQGYVRGIYGGTDKADVDRLKVEIKVLLSQ